MIRIILAAFVFATFSLQAQAAPAACQTVSKDVTGLSAEEAIASLQKTAEGLCQQRCPDQPSVAARCTKVSIQSDWHRFYAVSTFSCACSE